MINDALKSTERDHNIEVRAQQDDISMFGDPAGVFGPGTALETILARLGKAGLEPNKKKFQVLEPRKIPAPTSPNGLMGPS